MPVKLSLTYYASRRIFSFDADFQLVRRRSAGLEWNKPKHNGHFFLDQKSVDAHLEKYTQDTSTGNERPILLRILSILGLKKRSKTIYLLVRKFNIMYKLKTRWNH
ncbi:hypothetical protein LOTGIDRAFT_176748 [Lottia gigantea]|uniref:Uncharacterized protein n=1 Tax=Lottia gigantea TaxID=225164 RepID=V4BVU4_LOTGI|nr:hypothetical protein LOTGIDRAFT_176748 [Lottia gigantea]ESO93164.1 hypothetical protein LOTGIDRAFT_176748 [Lottia gigantea]